MMTLPELIEKLKRLNANRSSEYVREFEAVLADIAILNDPDAIMELAEFFEDSAIFDELMFSIIHMIENFNDQVYVSRILSISPKLCANSPRWASIIFMRILNAESTHKELVRQLQSESSEIKITVRTLMEKINARNIQFMTKTIPVITSAS